MTAAEPSPSALDALQAVLPGDAVRAGRDSDAIAGHVPSWVAAPPDEASLRDVLTWARQQQQAVAPVGGRTQLAIGNPPDRLDGIVSTQRLSGIVDYPAGDLTITVRAGTTAAEIAETVEAEGQWSPLDALSGDSTVGGLLAVGQSGPWRPGLGALRDQVLETRVVHPDGRVTRSGARVVKNVTGYDLNKLFIGSLGTLGVLTEVCLRLRPRPEATATLLLGTTDALTAAEITALLRRAGLDPTGLAFVSPRHDAPVIDRPPGVVLGLLKLAGAAADVAWLRDNISTELPAGTTWTLLEEPEVEEPIWQWLRVHLRRETTLSGRLGTLPMQAGTLAASLPVEVDWVLRPWEGVVDWYWSGPTEQAAEISAAIHVAAQAHQAGRLLIHAPSAVKASGDVFGERPPGFETMRGLRDAFDPERVLNPGRFLHGL